MSYIRAFRTLAPSESLIGFLKHAGKNLETTDFENDNPLLEPRVYALNSLRVTLFERRARVGQDASDPLSKLHVVMAQPKITTTERRRTRPGVFETNTKRVHNPLVRALIDIEDYYLQDGEDEAGRGKLLLRASSIVDSTEDDYRGGGTELALLIDEGPGLSALDAQRNILEDKAKSLNAAKRLSRPLQQGWSLVIPFMVAPFDSEGQRDDFIGTLATEEPMHLPVYGIGVDSIQWQLKT